MADVGDGPRGARRPPVRLPANPLVHEIFTWVWLAELSAARRRAGHAGRRARRGVGRRRRPGVDAVWLMGVWERSPAGAAIARQHPAMAAAQRAALPDVTDDDVVGSAYCIRDYRVDDHLGGDAGLAVARARAGGARRRPGPRLRAQPRRARPPVGDRAPRVLRARHGRGPRRAIRTASSPSATPSSPAAATRTSRPGRRCCSSTPRRRRLRAAAADVVAVDRRAVRRRALRHGDADARRRLRAHVGRAGRRRPVARRRPGLLADGDRGGAGRATRTSCSGPRRTGTSSPCSSSRASTPATTSGSTTGSCDARAGGVDPRPPRRRPRLPGAHGAVRREPRRAAAGGRRSPPPAAHGGGRRRADAARRRAAPRGPGRRSPGARAR